MANPFTKSARDANDRGERDLAKRITTEGRIVSAIVKQALASGFVVTVNDGEENVLIHSAKYNEIMAHTFTTDEDILFIVDPKNGKGMGWVQLIYGNCGHDVISDHTGTPYFVQWIKSINDYADTFA